MFVVIGETTNLLVNALSTRLREQGNRVFILTPDRLASEILTLTEARLAVNGEEVRGVFFHAAPDRSFSSGYTDEDRGFVDAEVRSVWLAATQLEQIFAVNRYPALAWYEGLRWHTWRRYLSLGSVQLTPMRVGYSFDEFESIWHPYYSPEPVGMIEEDQLRVLGGSVSPGNKSREVLMVFNEIVNGYSTPTVQKGISILGKQGIRLARLDLDKNGKIISVDVQPELMSSTLANRVAETIVHEYHVHLHCRRLG